jgi:hypothetical protein
MSHRKFGNSNVYLVLVPGLQEQVGKLALQLAVAHSEIHTNIVRTTNPGHMLQNIREIEEPLDEDLPVGVRSILIPVHNVTWTWERPANNEENENNAS